MKYDISVYTPAAPKLLSILDKLPSAFAFELFSWSTFHDVELTPEEVVVIKLSFNSLDIVLNKL